MERLDTVGLRGMVGRFRPEQIEQQSTWDEVPDDLSQVAAMHQVHQYPSNASTVTEVNPLDPVWDEGFMDHGPNGGDVKPAGRVL